MLERELQDKGISVDESMASVVDDITHQHGENGNDNLLKAWWIAQRQNQDVPLHCRRYPPSVLRLVPTYSFVARKTD